MFHQCTPPTRHANPGVWKKNVKTPPNGDPQLHCRVHTPKIADTQVRKVTCRLRLSTAVRESAKPQAVVGAKGSAIISTADSPAPVLAKEDGTYPVPMPGILKKREY